MQRRVFAGASLAGLVGRHAKPKAGDVLRPVRESIFSHGQEKET